MLNFVHIRPSQKYFYHSGYTPSISQIHYNFIKLTNLQIPIFWTSKADCYVGLALFVTHVIVYIQTDCGSKEEAWSHIDHDNNTHEKHI